MISIIITDRNGKRIEVKFIDVINKIGPRIIKFQYVGESNLIGTF